MKNKTKLSTFDREMKDKSFRERFDKSYSEFLLSELIISIMDDDHKSVRSLAKEVDLSPTVIQKVKSGMQEDIKLSNFINIIEACGYHLLLEKNGKQIPIGSD